MTKGGKVLLWNQVKSRMEVCYSGLVLRAYWPNFYTVIAGSAFIVPSSTLQKVEPPSIDKDGIQSNVSASIGRTAYLRCKVKNLGHKSVSFQILKKSIKNIGRFPTFPIKFLCKSAEV